MPLPPPRRHAVLATVLVAPLLALTLAGCGGTTSQSTAAVAVDAAPTTTTSPAPAASAASASASASASPTPADSAADGLPARAAALAGAFSASDYGAVWDLACPGVRHDARRDDFAAAMATVLDVRLAHPTVLDTAVGDTIHAELNEPGVAVDEEALVRFDVTPGSAYPNPTLTAWFVRVGTGWLYCGMLPDA